MFRAEIAVLEARIADLRKKVTEDQKREGERPKAMPDAICEAVAAYFGVAPSKVYGKSARGEGRRSTKLVARARCVAMFLVRKHCPDMSYTDMGGHFWCDHTTAIYGVQRVEAALAGKGRPVDERLAHQVADVEAALGSRLPQRTP